jgi:hypothetical protein
MRIAQIVFGAAVVLLIVTQGFGAALVLLLILACTYVLGTAFVPVWMHARLRLPERPPFQSVELSDAVVPEVARARLIEHRDALVSRGFEPRGLIHQVAGEFPAGYLGLYCHRASSTRALSRVLMKPGKNTAVHHADLELEIRYEDGTSVELSNVEMTVIGLERVPGLAGQMPEVRDASRLFDYFLEFAIRYERERRLSERARVPIPDDVVMSAVYQEMFGRAYVIQHAAGLVRRTATDGIWRPTWKYALLMAATALSPGAEFFRRRLRVRAARLQRALDGDNSLTRAEHIAGWGWALLIVGLLLGTIAVVVSPTLCAVAASGMVIAWSLAGRKGQEADWRAIVVGGLAAAGLFGLPMSLVQAYPPEMPALVSLLTLMMVGLFVLPMVALTAAAVLVLEGFRAAASAPR